MLYGLWHFYIINVLTDSMWNVYYVLTITNMAKVRILEMRTTA
jgi:hypothetical protein